MRKKINEIKKNPMTLITQAELARREGVSKKEVRKWKQQGRLVLKGGQINYEKTKKLLNDTADPARAEFRKNAGRDEMPMPQIPPRKTISYVDARTAKEAARARLTQMEVKRQERELVNAGELTHLLIAANTAVKTRIRAIQSTAPLDIERIYGSNDRDKREKIRALLSRLHDEALTELSEWKPRR